MDNRGDILIWSLWEIQTDTITYVRFLDMDADTYRNEPKEKLLAQWEKEKKEKHGNKCHD